MFQNITIVVDLRKQSIIGTFKVNLILLCTEQKLRQLAEFLLHVQQDDQDCHCVLINRTAASPDFRQPPLTSRVSLTLGRQQRARDCDVLPPAGANRHDGIKENNSDLKEDNCGSMGETGGNTNTGRGKIRSFKGSVVVESKDLMDVASGVENDKPGLHLHIRVSCLSFSSTSCLPVCLFVCQLTADMSVSLFVPMLAPVCVFV